MSQTVNPWEANPEHSCIKITILSGMYKSLNLECTMNSPISLSGSCCWSSISVNYSVYLLKFKTETLLANEMPATSLIENAI